MNSYDIIVSENLDEISYIIRKNQIDDMVFETLEEAEEYIRHQEE